MFRTPNTLAICLGALLLGAATPPPAAGALQALAHDMTYGWATAHPLFATELGLSDEDGRLDTPSLAENAADLATIRNWEARLAAIPLSDASLHDRDDAALLGAQLVRRERSLTIYGRTSRDYAAPAEDIVDALFTQFQHLPVPSPAAVAGNGELELAWQRIVSRLRGAPAYIAAGEALVTSPGHLQGIIGSQELAGAPDFLSGALTNAAKAQLSAAEFAQFALARDRTLRAIAAAKSFIDAHVAAWPENFAMGRPAYDAMLRDEQLLPFSGADVERMASDELAHGWTVQAWVEHLAQERHTPIGPSSGGVM
jgi:hypothetical protein